MIQNFWQLASSPKIINHKSHGELILYLRTWNSITGIAIARTYGITWFYWRRDSHSPSCQSQKVMACYEQAHNFLYQTHTSLVKNRFPNEFRLSFSVLTVVSCQDFFSDERRTMVEIIKDGYRYPLYLQFWLDSNEIYQNLFQGGCFSDQDADWNLSIL